MCRLLCQRARRLGAWLRRPTAVGAHSPFPTRPQVCSTSPLVDCGSLPGSMRIDCRPEVVAQRLPDKALALLDGPPPEDGARPATPVKRFSMPVQTIGSHTSLASLSPGGGEGGALAPPPPPPPPSGLGPGRARRSDAEGSVGGASSTAGGGGAAEEEGLRQLSPFAMQGPTPAGPL